MKHDINAAPDDPDYGYKECPDCEGDGSIENKECKLCEGTGEIHRTFEDHCDEIDYRNELNKEI